MKEITVKEYYGLNKLKRSLYDVLMKTVKRSKNIRVKISDMFIPIQPKHYDLWDFTYSDILELKEAMTLKDGELIKECVRIVYGVQKVQDINILDLQNVNWIYEEFKELVEVETNELKQEYSEKEKAAGVEELERFGHFPSVDNLAKGDLLEHDKILQLPYHKVFVKLNYDKTLGQITKRLMRC